MLSRMRIPATFALVVAIGCGPTSHHNGNGSSDGGSGSQSLDACTGLQCQVANCAAMSKPSTTISGTVYAPNGTLPLYGVNVYVPNSDPGPMPSGLMCDQCSDSLPGSPVGKAVQTDESGHFTLSDMPSGSSIPLVITSGKWRRIISIPQVNACGANSVAAADTTFPKSITDATPNTKTCGSGPCVSMPKIAVTTGAADSLECLVRKLGIADKEITTSSGSGHVQLYTGNGVSGFDSGFAGGSGQTFASATAFWSSATNLEQYDIVILSCEGDQNPDTKPQAAMDAMKAYADMGGRVFASHWHNIWIGGPFEGGGSGQAPAVWTSIATWADNINFGSTDLIDETSNPKGMSFATWMLNVMGSTVRDHIGLVSGTEKSTCSGIDQTKAERWTYTQKGSYPQNFQFTTPNEAASTQRCGKVAFSDMHVSGGPGSGTYPTSCGTSLALTAQEKALAFMFFDIASCVSTTIL
jgi:hypothetical protein